MNLKELAFKKVAILGVGIEGMALAEFLRGYKLASITLLDRKSKEELEVDSSEVIKMINSYGFDFKFGDGYMDDLSRFDMIFRSPGVRYLSPQLQKAMQEGVVVSSQIKLFMDLCPAKIIGVTGTKGKGTTSSLIYEILKADLRSRPQVVSSSKAKTQPSSGEIGEVYLAGNIGTPAVTLLPRLKEEDWVILELSSFQLQDLNKSPHIALVLNVSSDHLDYHEDQNEYVEAKLSVVKYQTRDDFVLVNIDYLTSFEFAAASLAKPFFFSGCKSVDEGAFVRTSADGSKEVVLRLEATDYVVCNENEIKLVGAHNLENIAAASVAAVLAGASKTSVSRSVKQFTGLPHRLERVGEVRGVKVYNDSFSTNPDPAIAAIRSFKQPKLLIMGGSTKGADFLELAKEVASSDVRGVGLIGDEASKIQQALINSGYSGSLIDGGYELERTLTKLLEVGSSGDVLIFSPACASFDMFKNYKDRGEKFKELILQIQSEK